MSRCITSLSNRRTPQLWIRSLSQALLLFITPALLAQTPPQLASPHDTPSGEAQALNGFRVDSRVIDVKTQATIATNVTYICQSRALDWSEEESQCVTIFDFTRDEAVLVDGTANRTVVIPFTELLDFAQQANLRAQSNPVVRFAANPTFQDRRWDAASGKIILRHPVWSYEATIEEISEAELVTRYRAFADWSARLNTTLPGLPAGPRLELNQEVAAHGGVPKEVLLTRDGEGGARSELRSTHSYAWNLSDQDQTRLGEIDAWVESAAASTERPATAS